MTLPNWLKERIGTPTRGRGAKPARCIVCRADVLAGMNEDTSAFATITDPIPLSPLGEALALLDGRRTYRLARHNQGLALWVRTHWDIQGHPASDENITLTDHKCGAPPLPTITIKPIPLTQPKKSLIYDNNPPF